MVKKRKKKATLRSSFLGGVNLMMGNTIDLNSTKKRKRAGRPRGPSGKYQVRGKTVYEEQYEDYMQKEKAKERLRAYRAQQGAPRREYEEDSNEEQREERRTPPTYVGSENPLHAPNIARGELVGTSARNVVQDVDTVNRPIANPHGDYYTDIDPATGRPLLKKRIRERWAQPGAR